MVLITGDFNFADTTDWVENEDGFDFLPLIGESQASKAIIARETSTKLMNLGLFQMCDYKNQSGNVLDLIYTNSPELSLVHRADLCLLPSTKSDPDHNPLFCTIECSPVCTTEDKSDPIFSFRRANYDEIREYLGGLNILDSIVSNDVNDVNCMLSKLYQIIYETFDKFIPKASLRHSNKPVWHNKQLSHLKNIRNKRYKDLCNQRESALLATDQSFAQAKEEYESYRKQLFENFLREKADEAKTNPKSFWRYINDKRKSHKLPNTMTYEGSQATTDAEKADLFANYFQTVYSSHGSDNDSENFINTRQEANFFKLTVTSDTVYSVLSTLNTNKGSGHGAISALFLRECADELTLPLCEIFRRSLDDCIYPESFKIGQITPIFKAGKQSDVTNYRGVCVVPMVFDRINYNQLELIIHPRISTTQHGFLPNRNIETNLMEMSNKIHEAFIQKAQLDVFYADISKAFDCINTALCIRKLGNFPLSNNTLRWFVSNRDRNTYV